MTKSCLLKALFCFGVKTECPSSYANKYVIVEKVIETLCWAYIENWHYYRDKLIANSRKTQII